MMITDILSYVNEYDIIRMRSEKFKIEVMFGDFNPRMVAKACNEMLDKHLLPINEFTLTKYLRSKENKHTHYLYVSGV